MPNTQWNGEERRKNNRDHDTLVEMVQILRNHVDNFNIHREDFRKHEIRDENNFEKLTKGNTDIQRIVLIASGGLAVIVFFINLLFKH